MVSVGTTPAAVDKSRFDAIHTANADSGVAEIPQKKPEID